jgi:excisionase family DNA binding protein
MSAPRLIVMPYEEVTAIISSEVRKAVAEALASHGERSAPSSSNSHMTAQEAADALRCSPRQIRRLIGSGRLQAAKLSSGGSSRLLVTLSSVDRLLAEART